MEDIGPIILSHINCGSDYKSCTLVSRQWYRWVQLAHPCADTDFANHLATLLKMFPEANWDYHWLSGNPNITWEFVHEHQNNRELKWYALSTNPGIPWQIINSSRFSQYDDRAAHPAFPYADTLIEYDSPLWEYLSFNPSLTWDYILRHLDKPWNWNTLSRHPAVTWQNICDHPELPWDYEEGVSSNPNVLPEEFAKCTNPPINLDDLYRNPNITYEFVSAHPEIEWDWIELIQVIPVTADLIADNLDMTDMDWSSDFGLNPTVDIALITEFINRGWSWVGMLSCSGITWDDIMSLPLKGSAAEWGWISQNPNLTWRIIADNPQYPWSWMHISNNYFGKTSHIV